MPAILRARGEVRLHADGVGFVNHRLIRRARRPVIQFRHGFGEADAGQQFAAAEHIQADDAAHNVAAQHVVAPRLIHRDGVIVALPPKSEGVVIAPAELALVQ